MMKKVMSLFLVGLLSISLVACGGNNTVNSGKTDNSDSETSTPDSGQLKGKIEWVNWMGEFPGGAESIIEKFNEEYPDIEVESVSVGFADVRKQIISRYAAAQDADVYQLNMPWAKELVDLGALEPLDELMSADDTFDASKLVQEPMQKIDGNSYMLPLTAMHFVLFYNEDHFKEAGLEAPTTWEEMKAAAKKLTDPDNNRYGLTLSMSSSGAANGPILSIYPMLYSAGGRTMKDGKANINTPEMLKTLTLFDDLYADEVFLPGVLTKAANQSIDDFISGTASMMIQPSTHINTVRNSGTDMNFGVVAVPVPEEGGVPATRLHGWEVGIGSGSENKELAWTFISWLTSEEINAWIAEKAGQLPANLNASADYINDDPLIKKTFEMMSELEVVEELMLTPKSTDTWRVFTEEVQKMFLDDISPEEAVENIQKGWDDIFAGN